MMLWVGWELPLDPGEMMASDLAVTASRDGCRPGAIAAAQDTS